ncbi:MAG: SgcJ/EcaC family oxidoreductase [Planctomycetaceae bacterium]|nr:SgcJ/EcaC family oxidoreductase [Planctomycetaceae bacterium]
MSDESVIRDLQQSWFQATMAGEIDTICDLMTEDVVFLTPGRPPFGKSEFLESFRAMAQQVSMQCEGQYEEIVVAGDVAYARAKLDITVTPRNGNPSMQLSGYTLSVLRRSSDGKWLLSRDANLLTPVSG